jgi:predicted nucleic acid-binding protein
VTVVKVIDASAFGAVLFEEPSAEAASARLRGAALVAPQLLAYEIASVCLKKLRSHPAQHEAILQQFSAWSQIGIELAEIDIHSLPQFAEKFGLTSYDASYLMLAQQLGAELVTLDRQLARAAGALEDR